MSIYVPTSRYHLPVNTGSGGYRSQVVLTLQDDTEFEFELEAIGNEVYEGLIFIDLVELSELSTDYSGDTVDFEPSEVVNIKLYIAQSYTTIPEGYLDYLNENSTVLIDGGLYMVYFMTDGEPIYQAPFITIPPEYEGYKSGMKFINWKLANGEVYEYTLVTEDMLVNNILYLYGSVLLTIFLVWAVLKAKLPDIIVGLVMLTTTGLFTFLGWLPILVSLVGFTAIIFVMWFLLGGD